MIFLSLLVAFMKVVQAATNELLNALSNQCQLDHNQASNILQHFHTFVVKLELSFRQSKTNPSYSELLRELSAADVWLLLTRIDPSLLLHLKIVRGAVNELNRKVNLNESCLVWMDTLLGDRSDIFYLSYLELLIRSLSLSGEVKIVELSNKQMLSVISKFRKMYLEREYLFRSRNEEQHELYLHCLLIYTSLIKLPLDSVIADNTTFTLYSFFPSEVIEQTTSDNSLSIDMHFLSKYNIDPKKDFILFDNQLQLRKSTNLSLVNENWLQVAKKIPDERVRRVYYDDRMDLAYNVSGLDKLIQRFHSQVPTDALKWSKKVLVNICVAFDLIESLVAYEGHQVGMLKHKRKLLEVLTCYLRLRNI